MNQRPELSSLPGSSELRLQTTADVNPPSPPGSASSSSSSSPRRKREATVVSGSPPHAPAPQAELLLPKSWRNTLPPEQQEWVSRTLFVRDQTGRPVLSQDLQLWYHPPGPKLVYHQCPSSPYDFFQRPFFLWAPYRMWQYHLKCPDCSLKLTGCGIYRTVRKVLDTDGWYYMATEYLECRSCRKKLAGWSEDVRKQLNLHHQQLFPAVMAYKLSCDKKLLALMMDGSSVHHLHSFLVEQHTAEWMRRGTHFLLTCREFEVPGVQMLPLPPLPKLEPVPTTIWLMAAYAKECFSRIGDLRAKVTSTFGSILKMTSSKKVTTKLGGADAGIAHCMTSVGNELGQVLVSVLTKAEGSGLQDMSRGLQDRYQRAGKDPPLILYVDRDCCSGDRGHSAASLFPMWPQMLVRLDIRCFLVRLAAGVTSKSHPLYPDFLQGLSGCIFEWDQEELSRWRTTRQLEQSSSGSSSIIKEMSRHCRRHTRGVQETENLIDELIKTFMGATNTMGAPLLDRDRMKEVWSSERRHVTCIQDPPAVQLYTRTSQVTRGGVSLPVYRCARGSTSLHTYHAYLNRFIPGTKISGCYYQMYLLQALTRWNEDRAQGVARKKRRRCCNSQEQKTFSQLTQHFYGTLAESVTTQLEYTGELIGISYLYSQMGRTLQDFSEEPDLTMSVEEEEEVEEEELVEEEFDQFLLDPLDPQQLPPEPLPSSQSTPPSLFSSSTLDVGCDAAPGFDCVVRLAQRLVECCRRGRISSSEVEEMVELWEKLPDADKAPVNYPPRYRVKENFGKRRLVRSGGQATTWPDSSRLAEAVFVQLCVLHPSGTREGGHSLSRWTLILRDYGTIRGVLGSHPALRTRAGLQLFPVNQATLCQWHQRFISTQERATLVAETTTERRRVEESPSAPSTSLCEDMFLLEEDED